MICDVLSAEIQIDWSSDANERLTAIPCGIIDFSDPILLIILVKMVNCIIMVKILQENMADIRNEDDTQLQPSRLS